MIGYHLFGIPLSASLLTRYVEDLSLFEATMTCCIVAGVLFAGMFLVAPSATVLFARRGWPIAIAVGIVAGLSFVLGELTSSVFVSVVNGEMHPLAEDLRTPDTSEVSYLICIIALVVSNFAGMHHMIALRLEVNGIPNAYFITKPKQLDKLTVRLPYELRGKILHVTAQGHYVLVETTRGEHLLRMPLKQAISELSPKNGMPYQRSGWIRFDQIRRVYYSEGRARLETVDGKVLSASRLLMDKLSENIR